MEFLVVYADLAFKVSEIPEGKIVKWKAVSRNPLHSISIYARNIEHLFEQMRTTPEDIGRYLKDTSL